MVCEKNVKKQVFNYLEWSGYGLYSLNMAISGEIGVLSKFSNSKADWPVYRFLFIDPTYVYGCLVT